MQDAASIETLMAREQLPVSYATVVERYWRPLAQDIAAWKGQRKTIVIGVNGGQGSGKTTLCKFLEQCLLPELGLAAVTVALDDFYLGKAERKKLAAAVHPLFATRGVPGTHDAQMLFNVLTALKAGEPATLPVFDKAADDRAPTNGWRKVEAPVDVILFEGWCVGAAPVDPAFHPGPINSLERDEDPEGRWREYWSERLISPYQQIFALIDRLVMLRAPDMEAIIANRLEQERKLRAARPDGASVMSEEQVVRFVSFYERLTRWMLDEMPSRADAVFDVEVIRSG